jgi:hypothetical protein
MRKSRALSTTFTPLMVDITPGSSRKLTKLVRAARSSGFSSPAPSPEPIPPSVAEPKKRSKKNIIVDFS